MSIQVSKDCQGLQYHDGTDSHYYNPINGTYIKQSFSQSSTIETPDFKYVADYRTRNVYKLNSRTGVYNIVNTHATNHEFGYLFSSMDRFVAYGFTDLGSLTDQEVAAMSP